MTRSGWRRWETGIDLAKHQGRISEKAGTAARLKGKIGIGHTRWATHGIPNDRNAHPHTDCSGKIAVVHNGIIENYADLKRHLQSRGHTFRSETDTEVIVHLIEEEYAKKPDLLIAVQAVIPKLEGSYAILVIAAGEDRIIAARNASPLVIGVGDGEFFAASDMTPVIEFTERAIFLEDGDTVSLSKKKIEIFHNGKPVTRPVELIDWSLEDVRKGGFAHYMLKEIYEQPQAFYNTIRSVDPDTSAGESTSCKIGYSRCMWIFLSYRSYLQVPSRSNLRYSGPAGICLRVQIFPPTG